MRFSRGMRVEVLSTKKVPSGVWRCAEIVADKGDTYTVRYYRRPGVLSDIVEKVAVEFIRPCPPKRTDSVTWAVGDTVEVLDNGYWKKAKIEEVMEEDYYYVHLVGSIDEFRVEKSSIRARQEWRDSKWVLIEKDSGILKVNMSRKLKKDHLQGALVSALSNSLKRLSPDTSVDEASAEPVQKRRAIEKGEPETIPGDAYSFIGKVDILACPRRNQVKDNVKTLTKKKITLNNANLKYQGDCISTASSSASCSIINASPDRLLSHSSAGCSHESDSLCSDAESYECFRDEVEYEGKYASRVHEVELNVYCHILEALYASGPLSWEQELILTNLRIKLYISNDEHLMELRRLKSIGDFCVGCC